MPSRSRVTEESLRRARLRLLLWGARERERVASGDGSAMPRKGEVLQTGPGVRGNGKPGDLPASLHDTMDVDMAIAAWNEEPFIRGLLEFVYRDGIEEETLALRWFLRDGSDVRLEKQDDGQFPEEPASAVRCEPETKRRRTYDLEKFQDPVLDRDLQRYYPRGPRFKLYRKQFLHHVLNDFIEHLDTGWC